MATEYYFVKHWGTHDHGNDKNVPGGTPLRFVKESEKGFIMWNPDSFMVEVTPSDLSNSPSDNARVEWEKAFQIAQTGPCSMQTWVDPVCVGGPLYPDFDGWSRNDGGGWAEKRRDRLCIAHVGDYALYVAMRDEMPHVNEAKKEWLRRYPNPIGGNGWKGWSKWASELAHKQESETPK